MPTPLQILLDPVSLIFFSMYAGLMLWEALFPARKLPRVKNWKLYGFLSFLFFFFLSSYLPLIVDPYLEPYRLMNFSMLNPVAGGIVGILIYEFGLYVWHRSLHTSNFLWRGLHQMHHSAERLDTWGAFWFSPLDMVGFTLLGSICFAGIIGLSPQAITIVLLATNFLAVFQHANIRTPHWIGYLVQRPEGHAVHHAKGVHRYNYSDLSVFDMLFGTFRNPHGYDQETGFYQGASARVGDMLRFRDVSRPPVNDDQT